MSSENVAILLVSHGSSLPYGKETFTEIHEKFKQATNLPTEVGYMKVEEPSIAGAINLGYFRCYHYWSNTVHLPYKKECFTKSAGTTRTRTTSHKRQRGG